MATREIPRAEWPEFFTSFTRLHEGWLCSVEILDPAIGAQVQATDALFMGIAGELDDVPTIEIVLGDDPERHLSHMILGPDHIWLEQTERGADEALAVDSGATRTLLRFRSPMLPEEVDGV
jgi:hypothetical protein